MVSALSCYLIGVKDNSRLVLAGSPWHLLILVVTSVSLAVDVNAYVYIVGALSAPSSAFRVESSCYLAMIIM